MGDTGLSKRNLLTKSIATISLPTSAEPRTICWTNYSLTMEHIENILQAQIDLLFDAVADHYELESGDLSPRLQQRLDNCAEELQKILVQFVKRNQ